MVPRLATFPLQPSSEEVGATPSMEACALNSAPRTCLSNPGTYMLRFFPGASALLLTSFLMFACGGDRDGTGVFAEWESEELQEGDTLVVRTLVGSVWGDSMRLVEVLSIGELEGAEPYLLGSAEAADMDSQGRIWIADGQAAEVRVFGSDGRHLFTVGGRGGGPGEFSRPDDLKIAPNGEVVVRDQQGARFSVFSPEGEFLRSWPIQGGFLSSTGFHMDHEGRIRNPTLRNMGAELGNWQAALAVFDGLEPAALDTLDTPTRGYETPFVEARGEGWVSRNSVPFSPGERWALGPDGTPHFIFTGRSRWERWNPDGSVFAAERVTEAAPLNPVERSAARERIIANFRQMDPSWRWSGPEIPNTKPFLRGLVVGVDGSVWLHRHVEAFETDNPDWSPMSPEGIARTGWPEANHFDVWDADGRFMGPVRLPDDYIGSRKGRFSLDRLLLVVTHPLGYEQVVLYRVEPVPPSDG